MIASLQNALGTFLEYIPQLIGAIGEGEGDRPQDRTDRGGFDPGELMGPWNAKTTGCG